MKVDFRKQMWDAIEKRIATRILILDDFHDDIDRIIKLAEATKIEGPMISLGHDPNEITVNIMLDVPEESVGLRLNFLAHVNHRYDVEILPIDEPQIQELIRSVLKFPFISKIVDKWKKMIVNHIIEWTASDDPRVLQMGEAQMTTQGIADGILVPNYILQDHKFGAEMENFGRRVMQHLADSASEIKQQTMDLYLAQAKLIIRHNVAKAFSLGLTDEGLQEIINEIRVTGIHEA